MATVAEDGSLVFDVGHSVIVTYSKPGIIRVKRIEKDDVHLIEEMPVGPGFHVDELIDYIADVKRILNTKPHAERIPQRNG